MKLETRDEQGVTVISFAESEEIDLGNVEEFKAAALEAIGDARKVVLELAKVEFFDSAGLGSLLSLRKELGAREGTLVLVGLSKAVSEVFNMAGFDVVFHVFPDLRQALDSLR